MTAPLMQADILSYLPEDLSSKSRPRSIAHGLGVQVAVAGSELIDFSCTLPPFWKIKNGETKGYSQGML